MEIGGLPLHPLVVHAAVVMTPLAALAVVVFAVWPKHRWLTRLPAAVLAVVALGSVWAARITGQSMLDADPSLAQLVATHQDRGKLLSLVIIGFAVLALLGTWSLPGPTALASGRGARESRAAVLDKTMPAVLVLVSVAVLVAVVLTGDAGSRAVWG